MSNNETTKQQLRKKYLHELKILAPSVKKTWDASLYQQFMNSINGQTNHVFALYWSLPHEVDTHQIIKSLLQQKQKVCLPRIVNQTLVFYYINDFSELTIDNKWKIAQPPATNQIAEPQAITVMVVPLLAFNHQNYRLGYGGGYYDRYLANQQTTKALVGLAYPCQKLNHPNFKFAAWDIPLTTIFIAKG